MEKLLSLDKAIDYYYKKYEGLNNYYHRISGAEQDRKCALEYLQIYKWLKELKAYKKKGKIVYLCDRRACKECNSESELCNHTSNIEHARNFKKIADTYFEK